MNVSVKLLLREAVQGGYAIGAFNVYNLESVLAVIGAATAEHSPVILQLHPAALRFGGMPLVALCSAAATKADVPVAVHLDHSTAASEIRSALAAGIASIMVDGSALPFAENLAFTEEMTTLAHESDVCVEAELGRLSGTEDDVTVADRDAMMTDPAQAHEFVQATRVDALAVCIGNVHGAQIGDVRLDFDRLIAIHERIDVPLVLHGASSLPLDDVQRAIKLGVAKFNVNTEVRNAYIGALRRTAQTSRKSDLLPLMDSAVAAMQEVVIEKLRYFGSSGNAISHVSGADVGCFAGACQRSVD